MTGSITIVCRRQQPLVRAGNRSKNRTRKHSNIRIGGPTLFRIVNSVISFFCSQQIAALCGEFPERKLAYRGIFSVARTSYKNL